MAGVRPNLLRDIKVHYYVMLLQLLRIGVPYDAIQHMSQQDIFYLLTVNMVQEERQQERYQQQQHR